MITYEDLVRPLKEGGHYAVSPQSIYSFLKLVQEGDRALLYQCHMFDSSQMGRTALIVAGPDRTIDDPDNPPKRIGNAPSNFKELEGEVDINSLRAGLKDFDPISQQKCIRVCGDHDQGALLWETYLCTITNSGYQASVKGEMAPLKERGLVAYQAKYPAGWTLTTRAWGLLEE